MEMTVAATTAPAAGFDLSDVVVVSDTHGNEVDEEHTDDGDAGHVNNNSGDTGATALLSKRNSVGTGINSGTNLDPNFTVEMLERELASLLNQNTTMTVSTPADAVVTSHPGHDDRHEVERTGAETDTDEHGHNHGHTDRKSTRLNSSHSGESRMPSSA